MNFVQCAYTGQVTKDSRRFDGVGRYTFANGDVYVGGMQDGQFHGQGVVFFRTPGDSSVTAFPVVSSACRSDNELKAFLVQAAQFPVTAAAERDGGWSGQYRGVWEHGRHVAGQYVFQDGLIYGNEHTDHRRFASALWNYCHGSDRRLWAEYLENVAPVLPHEALLGGARVLHARKQTPPSTDEAPTEEGEGLPMVLPNAFVKSRAAPAFATGQLVNVQDPRVVRWTAAAALLDEKAGAGAAESPEMIESTIALQLALANSTAEVRAQGQERRSSGSAAATAEEREAQVEGGAARKLNLTVCRVKDVEDVNRVLVSVSPALS